MSSPFVGHKCPKCGHKNEPNIRTLIMRAAIRAEAPGRDSSFFGQLDADLRAISPALQEEIQEQGSQHPHADKTLTELRQLYA